MEPPASVEPQQVSSLDPQRFARVSGAPDGVRPESLELNKSVTRRVCEEGLNQGRFEVPYCANFVGHGGRRTFTSADGMAEAMGWRKAFPDLKITVNE